MMGDERYGISLLTDGSRKAERFRRVLEHFGVTDVREVAVDHEEAPEVVSDDGVERTIEGVERLARKEG
ncbi:MAG: hypothetical protein SV186_00275 [Candidatus Nanohaloarchaea archaeon]|nr:hypothetical protein [Candidatus Nanohaloarchaea archaeon]